MMKEKFTVQGIGAYGASSELKAESKFDFISISYVS